MGRREGPKVLKSIIPAQPNTWHVWVSSAKPDDTRPIAERLFAMRVPVWGHYEEPPLYDGAGPFVTIEGFFMDAEDGAWLHQVSTLSNESMGYHIAESAPEACEIAIRDFGHVLKIIEEGEQWDSERAATTRSTEADDRSAV